MTTQAIDAARLWRFPNGDWGGDEFDPDPGGGARLVDVVAGVSVAEVEGMRAELAELRGLDDRVLDLEAEVRDLGYHVLDLEAEVRDGDLERDELRGLLGEALAFVADGELCRRIGRAGVSHGE